MNRTRANDSYSFAQKPKPVRQKYRDPYAPQEKTQNTNIMHNRRVFRGNTYAAQVLPLTAQAEELEKRKRAERFRKRRQTQQLEAQRRAEQMELDVAPVDGRKHIEIQTEMFLEEITDRVIEQDQSTQTDPFMDRPDSPVFVPAKSGVDMYTQIEEDLFDFDFEVEPILEVIVGKTLEQSMLEVMEEEEMAELKRQQEQFDQIRTAELAETQRLERAEVRRNEEKAAAKEQEEQHRAAEEALQKRMQSREFAKRVFENLEDKVLSELESEGFFFDVVEREVETDFLPWLRSQVNRHLESKKESRDFLDSLIRKAVENASSTSE
mmetsp:Transcript_11087/g.16329  ORF Transcript_11087/g.16329 Transcript_11087/m.16329 type:complete len:323 (-) Transcript_11087:37-1005(-)